MTMRFPGPMKNNWLLELLFQVSISLPIQREDAFSDRWTCSFCWAFHTEYSLCVCVCDLTLHPQAFQFVYIDVLVESYVTWTTERELARRIKGGERHFLPLFSRVAGKRNCCEVPNPLWVKRCCFCRRYHLSGCLIPGAMPAGIWKLA